jgi:hypothetical protein
MNVQRSLKHIGKRFNDSIFDQYGNKRPKPFGLVPNKTDFDAYNELVEYVDIMEKNLINNQQLFGKLYIYLFTEFVKHYNCTVMDDIPQKELHKLLDKDLRVLVTEAQELLNLCELESAIKNGRHKEYSPMEYSEMADNFKSMISAAITTYGKN